LTLAIGACLAAAGALAGLGAYSRLAAARAERRYPPLGAFVTVEGGRVHYLSRGSGRAVVLLHGNGGTVDDYRLSGALDAVAARWRAVAIDRPGHGYSERTAEHDVASPLTQARRLRAALRALGVDHPILVGHSWSGGLVLAWALAYPDEVAGIVLLQGTVYPEPALDGPVYRLLRMPIVGDLFLATLGVPLGRRKVARAFARAFAPDPVPADALALAQALFTRPAQAKAIAEDNARRMEVLAELSPRYPSLRVPMVVVAAGADRLIPPERQAYRLANDVPGAELMVIPGAGHQLPHSRPQVVVDAVERLTRRLESAA